MGILPKERVEPKPPFFVTGVDYAGPVCIKNKLGRGSSTTKGYICLFVCFTTRAIHLELVTSLSTEAFIAVFRRFVARRGKPQKMYSDNGKNFVGAARELVELSTFLCQNENALKTSFSNEGVDWSFIPAYSPHFGGLWEAGVKSVKFHLKRVISNVKLTYEEFSTVLTQVEGILNSRPITPLSSDPRDLDVLTPGHFLIGRRICSLPDPNLTDIPEGKLNRLQKLQQLYQHFWRRWSKEYVLELQHRTKWKTNQGVLEKGAMVLVKDDTQPPLCWAIGRVVQLHPGPDGVSRVATVQTANGVVKRSFSKLCPLPLCSESSVKDN